jgi:hypothetical protein
MSLIAFPSTDADADRDSQSFEQLAAGLSSRLGRLRVDENAVGIVRALNLVAAAVDVDASALLEFGPDGDVSRVRMWPECEVPFGPLVPQVGRTAALIGHSPDSRGHAAGE